MAIGASQSQHIGGAWLHPRAPTQIAPQSIAIFSAR